MPANDNAKQQYLAYDVTLLERELADLIAAYPELEEDEELRADVIEGETNALDVLSRLVSIEREAHSMSAAIADRIKDLQGRKAREERRKEAVRALMLRLMKAGNLPKAKLTEATLSIAKGRDGVEIYDTDALPDEFVKTERVPDKRAILEIVKGCGEIPGARLAVGDETLSVRAA